MGLPTSKPGTFSTVQQDDALFRLFVQQVKDYAIFMIDPTGHVMSWNAGAELLKGYRAEDIIGQSIEQFYTEEDRLANRPQQLLHMAARDGRLEDEGWRVRKDGSRFWADVVITAIRDSSHHLYGFAKVTRDLTERRRSEETLWHARQDLERQVQERTCALQRLNQELYEKNQELEKFSDVVVGRELKMMELEKEVEQLRNLLEKYRQSSTKS